MPTAEINGIRMHYIDEGEGEAIVLVHGLGSSSHDWEYQTPVLSQHFRVIAPCMRGFGDSEKPAGPHSVKTWSEDLLALIEYLDLPQVHLVGFSMGGAISFQAAADSPEFLKSLVILNSLPSFELDHWTKHMMVLSRIAMAKTLGMPRLARYVARRMFPAPEQAELQRRMIERHSRNDQQSYINAVNALAGWTIGDQVERLAMPVLVLAADEDFTPVAEKEDFVSRMMDARLTTIANSRHVSHVDQADVVNAAILEFTRSLRGG